jgi:hypothetical protein
VDVLVIGGGPAGCAAGITCGRRGLRTLLVENQNTLGGLATNGYVNGVAGIVEGLCKEWLDRLEAKGALCNTPHSPGTDPEKAKFELENMLLQAGTRILYGVLAVDVNKAGNNIESVVCYSKSGRMEIRARLFIDASGDADIAAAAGVPYEVGDAEYMGLNMAHTMGCRMSHVNLTKYRQAFADWVSVNKGYPGNFTLAGECMDKAVENGDLPYPIFPGSLINQIPGAPDDDADVTFLCGHSYYCRNLDKEDLSRQIVEQHQQNIWLEEVFRKYVPGFEACKVTGVGSLPGIRDSRRIVGEYVLKDTDVVAGVKFEDGVTRFPEHLDTHHPTSRYNGFRHHIHSKEPISGAINLEENSWDKAMHPFCPPEEDIYGVWTHPANYCESPYRVLVPLNVDNLLVAGRSVSAEFHAMAAVRVIAVCFDLGEAAGIAADRCLREGIRPRDLDGKKVRQDMIDSGIPLDKIPDGYWAFLAEVSGEDGDRNEYVRLRGDMMGVRQPDGTITMRFGTEPKSAQKPTV